MYHIGKNLYKTLYREEGEQLQIIVSKVIELFPRRIRILRYERIVTSDR